MFTKTNSEIKFPSTTQTHHLCRSSLLPAKLLSLSLFKFCTRSWSVQHVIYFIKIWYLGCKRGYLINASSEDICREEDTDKKRIKWASPAASNCSRLEWWEKLVLVAAGLGLLRRLPLFFVCLLNFQFYCII